MRHIALCSVRSNALDYLTIGGGPCSVQHPLDGNGNGIAEDLHMSEGRSRYAISHYIQKVAMRKTTWLSGQAGNAKHPLDGNCNALEHSAIEAAPR